MEIIINGARIYVDTRTTEKWTECELQIPKGFPCLELTEDNKMKLKFGDGVHTFAQLPYIGADIDMTQLEQLIKEQIEKVLDEKGNLFEIQGTVPTTSDLPNDGNKKGDVYLVGDEEGDEFAEYYWNGSRWDYMGTTTSVDLSNYYNKGEIDEKLADCINKDDVLILNCSLSEG